MHKSPPWSAFVELSGETSSASAVGHKHTSTVFQSLGPSGKTLRQRYANLTCPEFQKTNKSLLPFLKCRQSLHVSHVAADIFTMNTLSFRELPALVPVFQYGGGRGGGGVCVCLCDLSIFQCKSPSYANPWISYCFSCLFPSASAADWQDNGTNGAALPEIWTPLPLSTIFSPLTQTARSAMTLKARRFLHIIFPIIKDGSVFFIGSALSVNGEMPSNWNNWTWLSCYFQAWKRPTALRKAGHRLLRLIGICSQLLQGVFLLATLYFSTQTHFHRIIPRPWPYQAVRACVCVSLKMSYGGVPFFFSFLFPQ